MSVHGLCPVARVATRGSKPKPLCLSKKGDQEDSSPTAVEEVSRREALRLTAAGVAAGLTVNLNNVPPSHAFVQNVKMTSSVVPVVQQLEVDYRESVNSNGAPEKHLPQTTVQGTKIQVVVPHVMDPEKPHYIEYIWLKDVTTNKVLKAKKFQAQDASPPTLNAIATKGSIVKPFLFCNLHGLWQGEEITV